MSIPGTTVSSAVAFIFAGITSAVSAVANHDLYVEYGEPLSDNEGEPVAMEPDDQIFLLDVVNSPKPLAMLGGMGAGAMSESYRITWNVRVRREDADPAVTFDRCVSMVDSIVGVVRADPTLGGAVLSARPDAVRYPAPASTNDGTRRVCETEVTIVCFAVD